MSAELLYFDNNATTALAPEALDAMLPWLREDYGNPSSTHAFGQRAAGAVASARAAVARLLGAAAPREVVFTSGGTESLNTALSAALRAGAERGAFRVLTSAAEHSSVERPLAALEGRAATPGAPPWSVERVGVDGEGRLDVERLLAAIGPDVALVALILANNETGVVLPREELARVGEAARSAGVPVVLDAVQAAGKLPLEVRELPVDFVAISGHKFHGPKGSGALWVRPGAPFAPLLRGGPQEGDRRAGTENVAGIAGLGRAAELALEHLSDPEATARLGALRGRLEEGLAAAPGARVVGKGAPRVPNTANVLFPGISGEALLLLLSEEGLAVSTGSACDSGHSAPSHVITAMGFSEEEAGSTLRFSLSRHTREEEVDRAVAIVARACETLHQLAPR